MLDRDAPKGIKLGSFWGYVGVKGEVQMALYLYASTGEEDGPTSYSKDPEVVDPASARAYLRICAPRRRTHG